MVKDLIWNVGDWVMYNNFGEGIVIYILGKGYKVNLVIKFFGIGVKIIDFSFVFLCCFWLMWVWDKKEDWIMG